jgi:DNA polymerase-3 subunit epsilon
MRETINDAGYIQVVVERTDFQDVDSPSVLALSRSMMQAKKMLNEYAKEHNLCPALLGIEKSSRGCFFSQLGICKGACIGKESSESYNARVRGAFAKRKVRAWPYSGPVVIKEEKGDSSGTGTLFIVDDWRLINSIAYDEAGKREFLPPSYHFDHDAYKILASHLHKKKGFKPISSHEMRALLSHEEAVFSIDF